MSSKNKYNYLDRYYILSFEIGQKSGQNALMCWVKAPDTIATEVSKLPMLARMTGWNASGLNTEQAHLLT